MTPSLDTLEKGTHHLIWRSLSVGYSATTYAYARWFWPLWTQLYQLKSTAVVVGLALVDNGDAVQTPYDRIVNPASRGLSQHDSLTNTPMFYACLLCPLSRASPTNASPLSCVFLCSMKCRPSQSYHTSYPGYVPVRTYVRTQTPKLLRAGCPSRLRVRTKKNILLLLLLLMTVLMLLEVPAGMTLQLL